MGEREVMLDRARTLIEHHCGKIIKTSSVYETEPWGFEADTPFLNQALLVDTPLLPEALLNCCLRVETALGRKRPTTSGSTYTSRNIDIDVLFYEEEVCSTQTLTLPHPHLHLRKFALEPLAEVAPKWIHPLFGVTALALCHALPARQSP